MGFARIAPVRRPFLDGALPGRLRGGERAHQQHGPRSHRSVFHHSATVPAGILARMCSAICFSRSAEFSGPL